MQGFAAVLSPTIAPSSTRQKRGSPSQPASVRPSKSACPLAFPPGSPGPALVFELDETRFPDGSVERELELELPPGADAAAVEHALRALLASLGLPFESAPSKAARFFRILERMRGPA